MGKGSSAVGEGLLWVLFPFLWVLWLAWSKDLPETWPQFMETGKSCHCFWLPRQRVEGIHMRTVSKAVEQILIEQVINGELLVGSAEYLVLPLLSSSESFSLLLLQPYFVLCVCSALH